MDDPILHIDNLTVTYGAATAVDALSLTVQRGAILGVLGPNGAGKSSMIRCLATTQRQRSGRILIDGVDTLERPDEVRRRVGVVPQELALYEPLSVEKNLQLFGGLVGLSGEKLAERVAWGLALAQLGDHRRKRVSALSGGMKRRLNIAISLLHDPELLVFDEPTAGVDPQSRNHIMETIRHLHDEGRTVVYTTHYMEEVEALCDQVAILDRGRLILNDTLADVLATTSPRTFNVSLPEAISSEALTEKLAAVGLGGARVESEQRTLEQVFLDLTGREVRDTP